MSPGADSSRAELIVGAVSILALLGLTLYGATSFESMALRAAAALVAGCSVVMLIGRGVLLFRRIKADA